MCGFMKAKVKKIIRAAVFLILGVLIVWGVTKPFGVSNQYSEHAEMMINGYYAETENTVDAVLIGNSHVYRYWQGAFAWEDYGIASLAVSTSDMPYGAIKNVAIEACKTQDPSVLILDATVFNEKEDNANNKIYLLLDNMKYSANYFDMIRNFCTFSGVDGSDRLPYYFPIMQFHSRWKELSEIDFKQTMPSYLNSCYQQEFLENTAEVKPHQNTFERQAIAPGSEAALRDLLEWCQDQEMEILFYAAPVMRRGGVLERFNYIGDVVEEYGFPFVNFNEDELFESCGFDEAADFQDKNHTNVKGSYKFTKAFAGYLIENYGLSDHRGEELYASWDTRAAEYAALVAPYL